MEASDVRFVRDFDAVAAVLAELGARRVMLVTAPSRRFVDELTRALTAFAPIVFDGAQVHVPIEVVEAAEARLADADTIVAIGGGSAIGLGKALRVRGAATLRFVALPTTYAGSEMTTMYGITTGADKRTGREARARPDVVIYDVALFQHLPITLTVQSLANSLAHVVSVLSTASLDPATRAEALAAAATVVHAIEVLPGDPASLAAREQALRGASACAAAFDRGKPGAQHALAHLLGGALRLEHAALHAILLPHFIAHVRETQPAIVDALEQAIWPGDRDDHPPLAAHVHAALVRAGAPVALAALGATAEAIERALATRPELPGEIARAAWRERSP